MVRSIISLNYIFRHEFLIWNFVIRFIKFASLKDFKADGDDKLRVSVYQYSIFKLHSLTWDPALLFLFVLLTETI